MILFDRSIKGEGSDIRELLVRSATMPLEGMPYDRLDSLRIREFLT